MRQVHPKSLISDGDLAMAKAISKVMPRAYHRLCTWYIEENMSHHLRKPKLDELRKLIYKSMDEEEFERRWADFKENGGTGNGQWIALIDVPTKGEVGSCLYRWEILVGYAQQPT
jgi:zinc finger SWIM domain-containing protein 3